ncbi:MAG: four helix bundle protein [Candidatus Peribacteraceae bacterium]|jgi:four helix bundle protein|nr:four helix bundle protein [Candidatus Peribacteraceae bacterium]MDP7454304.1 four helix bundle protein [Candidatus Peribacteraceae bacterium]MDP7645656.1 four helix bundle protein [Candidatus Peribacteraceae bacterium]|tara:strand:- start:520 stop:873 length:354 start_codon:yes stop_codon:yes gene_type:complete
MQENGPAEVKSFEFSVLIIEFCGHLNNKKAFVISKQLLRSGTSIGANIQEAQYAESKKDFAHKMHIALKEARETRYWLQLINVVGSSKKSEVKELLIKVNELIKLLTAIVKTSKKNN